MSHMQCWGLHSDGQSRCPASAMSCSFFCVLHQTPDGPDPADIFCLSEAEMPPRLVEHIRDCCPAFVFPSPPVPKAACLPEMAPLPTADEPSRPGTDCGCAGPPPSPQAPESEAPLAWLMGALREAMAGLMGSDATPLQKANAAARLGSLCVRTYRTTELAKENRELKQRVDGLEKQLADARAELEAMKAAVPTNAEAFEARSPQASPSGSETEAGAQPTAFLLPEDPRASTGVGMHTPGTAPAYSSSGHPPD
jgi:hypothetical protein